MMPEPSRPQRQTGLEPSLVPAQPEGRPLEPALEPPPLIDAAADSVTVDASRGGPDAGDRGGGTATRDPEQPWGDFKDSYVRWEGLKKRLHWVALGVVGLAAAAVVALGLLGPPSAGGEHGGMQAAVQQLDAGRHDVGLIRPGGALEVVSQVALTAAERDAATTAAVRTALAGGDEAVADRAFQNANILPALADPQDRGPTPRTLTPEPPRLTPAQKAAIRDEQAELYRINLWDCCDEDGDLIQVLVNDVPYATVPLVHGGSTLLVPIPKGGTTTIALKGLRDGEGGGVTTGIHTSGGDFILRSIQEGEVLPLRAAGAGESALP